LAIPAARRAYVARRGHCSFVTSEIVAGVQALQHRIDTGYCGGGATDESLESAAIKLGRGDGPAFVHFRPGPFVSHRGFGPSRDGGG